MYTGHMEDMVKGWFVGNFEPSIYKTTDAEVAIKTYRAGEYEKKHFHKIATEITVIAEGEVEMNGKHYMKGDIVVMEPYDQTDFRAVRDTVNVVVKIPGANNDKYEVTES